MRAQASADRSLSDSSSRCGAQTAPAAPLRRQPARACSRPHEWRRSARSRSNSAGSIRTRCVARSTVDLGALVDRSDCLGDAADAMPAGHVTDFEGDQFDLQWVFEKSTFILPTVGGSSPFATKGRTRGPRLTLLRWEGPSALRASKHAPCLLRPTGLAVFQARRCSAAHGQFDGRGGRCPPMTKIRTGQAPAPLTRAQFHERFQVRFYDPAFEGEREAIARLEAIAWDALQEGRKAPITQPPGRGFADPTYDLSVEWLDTRARLQAAQKLLGRQRSVVARAAGLRLAAQRRHLPGRDVEDLPAGRTGARGAVEAQASQADLLDLSLAHLRLRPQHPSVQGLRVDARCRCATGRAAATRTMRWTRPTTGWPRSTSAGWRRTA